MKNPKDLSKATILYEDELPNCCPLCGRLITHTYPEIKPGIRYGTCQSGHKIRIEKEDYQQKTAG